MKRRSRKGLSMGDKIAIVIGIVAVTLGAASLIYDYLIAAHVGV